MHPPLFLASLDAVQLGVTVGEGGVCGRMLAVARHAPLIPLLGGGRHQIWLTDPRHLAALVVRGARAGEVAGERPRELPAG